MTEPLIINKTAWYHVDPRGMFEVTGHDRTENKAIVHLIHRSGVTLSVKCCIETFVNAKAEAAELVPFSANMSVRERVEWSAVDPDYDNGAHGLESGTWAWLAGQHIVPGTMWTHDPNGWVSDAWVEAVYAAEGAAEAYLMKAEAPQ